MLILSRKIGQKIMIGHDIEVVVMGISNNQVKIGVKAPNFIPVHREEIYQRIQHEKVQQFQERP